MRPLQPPCGRWVYRKGHTAGSVGEEPHPLWNVSSTAVYITFKKSSVYFLSILLKDNTKLQVVSLVTFSCGYFSNSRENGGNLINVSPLH